MMDSATINDRTISDKESWLITHGKISMESSRSGYIINWTSKGGCNTLTAGGSTYFSTINQLYDTIKSAPWFNM